MGGSSRTHRSSSRRTTDATGGSCVYIVMLRQPRRGDPNEMRSDPFWEFGSFGCTNCHARNLLNPKRVAELEGARLAFAQGGRGEVRLVYLTPPIRIVAHANCCEVRWAPAQMPFRYDAAPTLIANDVDHSTDFPGLLLEVNDADRTTWVGKFASKFRSRTSPLDERLARELVEVYAEARLRAKPHELAGDYVDALPFAPPRKDCQRRNTYNALLAQAGGNRVLPGSDPTRIRSC